MSALRVLIVADDLTGALDTAVPFRLAGLRVTAALAPTAVAAAAATMPDVLAVSTGSREIGETDAAARIAAVLAGLGRVRPGLVLKKIDSRLKGHVAAETAALARALGFEAAVVAPAVPDQGRVTADGAVAGAGVAVPLPVAPVFAGTGLAVAVVDAVSDADLDRAVLRHDWTRMLAVGARGLGAALARREGRLAAAGFRADARTLFVIGSRDPVTERQVDRLCRAVPDLAVADAPEGRIDRLPDVLPGLLRCTGPMRGDTGVAARFAEAGAAALAYLRPGTVVMSGGETAGAILGRLGVDIVFPEGEAAPGLPVFAIDTASGDRVRCVVKSGGFGAETALADLVPPS